MTWLDKTISVLLVGVFLCAGCGSADGAPEEFTTSESSLRSGVFVNGPVTGLRYETGTQTGVTDEDGRFFYLPGEVVTFRLGDTVLGSTEGQAGVSPFDLVEGATVVTAGTEIRRAVQDADATPLEAVMNITILLYTFDEDGDPNNGIQIESDVGAAFEGVALEFHEDWYDFRTDAAFRDVLHQVNEAALFENSRAMVGALPAMDHLYDALGIDPTIQLQVYRGVHGDSQATATEIRIYDENGVLTRIEQDDDGDGTTDSESTIAYDDNGNLRLIETDSDMDGTADAASTIGYSANGRLTLFEAQGDYPRDGTPDWTNVYVYDENGHRTKYEADYDGDGTLDRIETYAYDESGNRSRHEVRDGGAGISALVEVSTYDEDGNLVRVEADHDGDEETDATQTYAYGLSGNLARFESDFDDDGNPDWIEVYTYDAYGNLARTEQDRTVDGTPDWIEIYVHDEKGNLIRQEEDHDADGTLDRIETWVYDEHGSQTRNEKDDNGDGVIDEVTTYAYQRGGWTSLAIESFYRAW